MKDWQEQEWNQLYPREAEERVAERGEHIGSGVGNGDQGKRLRSDHEVLHMLLGLKFKLLIHKELINEASMRIMFSFVL